jgi:hypothetical protein
MTTRKRLAAGVAAAAAESQPGSLGLLLQASPELGAAVLESFWAAPPERTAPPAQIPVRDRPADL